MDHKGTGVERVDVFGRTEPLVAEADHLFPVEPDEGHDRETGDVGHEDVGVEPGSSDVADGEHAEDVPGLGFDVFEVEKDVNGDKTGAAQ